MPCRPRSSACTARSSSASRTWTRRARRSTSGTRPRRAARCSARCCRAQSKVPFDVVNKLMTKREISGMIDQVYRHCGQKETVIFCDRIMALGFHHAFKAGISFGKDDMVVPQKKWPIVDKTRELAKEFEQQYNDGLITQGEKYNKVVDAWSKSTDQIADAMMKEISSVKKDKDGRDAQVNSIYMMAHSGARGSPAQMRQLAGMRGLMAKPSGEIIETPIISNFKEGLSVLEYFNSTHGARKGLADTALKTANSGYLTRRLVDVAQDCIITSEDCGTKDGIAVRAIIDAGTVVASLAIRILGRTTAEDVKDPVDRQGRHQAQHAARRARGRGDRQGQRAGAEDPLRAHLRELTNGVCGACYGRDLARGTPVNMGEAVGVIAAQSIGEPGTQLTMRTFHIGGAAQISEQSFIESNFDGKIVIKTKGKNAVVKNTDGDWIAMGRSIVIAVTDPDGTERAVHRIQNGARLRVEDGAGHQARPAYRRMGSLHPADPHRGRRHRRLRGPGRGPVDVGIGRRGDRHRQARGHRLAHLEPRRRPQARDGHQGQGRQDPEARAWRRCPLPAGGGRHSVGRSRRQGQAGRRDRAYPDRKRQDPRHHRRSAAGGGAVRGAQAEGRGGDRRNLRHRAVRQGLQEQAPAQHRADREGRASPRNISSPRASTSICRTATPSRRAITSSKATRRRTTSWRSRASRSSRTISSTRSRRSIGSRACRSTTSTSR